MADTVEIQNVTWEKLRDALSRFNAEGDPGKLASTLLYIIHDAISNRAQSSANESGASVGLDEAWEVVNSMAGGANVGPRFLSLARLVVSLDARLNEVEARLADKSWLRRHDVRLDDVESRVLAVEAFTQGFEDAEKGSRGLTVEERDAYRRTRARLFGSFEPVSQSSTRTPGIGADMEQADGERERLADGEYLAKLVESVVSWFSHNLKPVEKEGLRAAAAALRSSAPNRQAERSTASHCTRHLPPIRDPLCDECNGCGDPDCDTCYGSPAPVTPEEGDAAAPLCQKRFSMVTAPHKISNGIVQQPCELPDGHAGECGLHTENPPAPGERVERVEGWVANWDVPGAEPPEFTFYLERGHVPEWERNLWNRATLVVHPRTPPEQPAQPVAQEVLDRAAAALRSAQPAQPVAPSQMKAWLDPKLDYYASADFRAPPAPSELDEDAVEELARWLEGYADGAVEQDPSWKAPSFRDDARCLLIECGLSPAPISQPTELTREQMRNKVIAAFGKWARPVSEYPAEADRLLSELFPAKGDAHG